MNDSQARPMLPAADQDESIWTHIFKHWAMHYLLPGLLAGAVAIIGLCRQQQEKENKMQEEVEKTRQAVREGRAGEAFNRLFPDDHKANLRQSQPQKQ